MTAASHFVTRETTRIDLGAGDWVEILTRLQYGDRVALEEKLLGGATAGDATAIASRELRIGAANVELLRRSVVAWGGPGFCALAHDHSSGCEPAPITEEAIRSLDATAERILAELQKSLVTRTPGFQTPPSQPPSVTGAAVETSDSNGASSRSGSSSDSVGVTTTS